MARRNRFGLNRNIPEDIKEQIRNRSGFGCVVCGSIPYEYEHIDPEFVDAQEHDPERMALLCPTHNQEKKKGLLSKRDIYEFYKKPACLINKFAKYKFNTPRESLNWSFGGVKFLNNDKDVCVNGKPILSITGGRTEFEPLLLNGYFYDNNNRNICDIIDNELRIIVQNIGDFRNINNNFCFRSLENVVCLDFNYIAENKELIFNQLNFYYNGSFIDADQTKFICGGPTSIIELENSIISNCTIAINLGQGFPLPLHMRSRMKSIESVFSSAQVGIDAQ